MLTPFYSSVYGMHGIHYDLHKYFVDITNNSKPTLKQIDDNIFTAACDRCSSTNPMQNPNISVERVSKLQL